MNTPSDTCDFTFRFGGLSFLLQNELALIGANESEELSRQWANLSDSLVELQTCDNGTQV